MYGRVCVAVRDIARHELVLDDDPVALSPTQDSLPTCLSCLAMLPPSPHLCDCGFTLCSPQCSRGELHQPEHQLFVREGLKLKFPQLFDLIPQKSK